MKLYEKIAVLRKQHGLSQEELAAKLEVSRQSVHKWEQGLSYPELDKLKRLAQIFEVSFDTLLNDEIELSVPAAQIAKPFGYRSVYVSDNVLQTSHADFDHHVTADSDKARFTMPGSLKKTFAAREAELNNLIAGRGYDFVMAPQPDLNVRFFADEKRNVCGFFYDGAEQFVLPLENIIEANISPISGINGTYERYAFSISYFNKDGSTEVYSINFGCIRKYFQYIFWVYSDQKARKLANEISVATHQALIEICNKITALKAKGDALRSNNAAVEEIDVENLAKQSEESLKHADEARQLTKKEVNKSAVLFIVIASLLGAFTLATLLFSFLH